jgi:hypothetical protein
MEKGRGNIMKFLIVLISVVFIDGGRSFLLLGCNSENLISHNLTNDIEIPHQHHPVIFGNDEKFLESMKFEFSCFKNNSIEIFYTEEIVSQGFSDSIWQPPKFV